MNRDEDLRARLVATTVDLLRDQAPTEISLRAVARRLGVSSGAPYHHFPDKLALFAAVALEGWQGMGAALEAAGDDLAAVGEAYLRFALANPEHYRVMFLPELKDPAHEALHAASFGIFTGYLGRVAAALGRDPSDPDVVLRVVGSWSTVHGFAMLAQAGVLARKAELLSEEALIGAAVAAAVRAAVG